VYLRFVANTTNCEITEKSSEASCRYAQIKLELSYC